MEPVRIVAFGDSLIAGYGLDREVSFPVRLERYLRDRGCPVTVIDAGVSGDTTAGGRTRIGWALEDEPDLVIVELGANDALRGLDPARMEDNLAAVIHSIREAGAEVLLAGMHPPANLGREYEERFQAVFPRLARRYEAVLYPFFLEGVAGVPELNQSDGIHPNARGVEEIVRRIGPVVERLVRDIPGKGLSADD